MSNALSVRVRHQLAAVRAATTRQTLRRVPRLAERLAPAVPQPDLRTDVRYDAAGPYLDYADWPLITDDPNIQTDAQGVPLVRSPDRRAQYNPVTIAQLGLELDARAKMSDDSAAANQAMTLARFLAASQRRSTGVWEYAFAFDVVGTDRRLTPPWASAMAQGQAVSLLTRAHAREPRDEFLEAIVRALRPFHLAVEDGGITARLDGLAFYEEYPTSPPNFTLNGFMFALLGLFDAAQVLGTAEARTLYEEGVATLERTLPLFDTGSVSAYHLWHVGRTGATPHRSLFYHWIHVQLLTAIDSATPRAGLRHYRDMWLAYRPRIGDPR